MTTKANVSKNYFINLGAITLPSCIDKYSGNVHPMVKWTEFQNRCPTEEEYSNFEDLFKRATHVQIICGTLYFNGKPTGARLAVYDLDNPLAIKEFCNFNGKQFTLDEIANMPSNRTLIHAGFKSRSLKI